MSSMDVLPIRYITDSDRLLVGRELTDLAAIRRLGFSVPDGIIVFPPEIPLTETLKAFRDHDQERFESSLTIFKKKLLAIEPPDELVSQLKNHHVPVETVWRDALMKWIEQIRATVWKEDKVSSSIVDNLAGVPIFFTGKQSASGYAYFDSEDNKIIIVTELGSLPEKEKKEIEDSVEKLRKKFIFSYRLDWICDESGIFIIRVKPYEPSLLHTQEVEKVSITPNTPVITKKEPVKTTLKLFVDLSEGLVVEEDADGIFLASEKIETEDQKILKLVDSALTSGETVIFQLSDVRDKNDVSSALRLLHQPDLLKQEVRNYQFAKHNYTKQTLVSGSVVKQSLLHIELGIPSVRSVIELSEMKKKLTALGVERKGNQKLWIDLSIPQNWIEVKKYINEGVDGIIVNLDQLYHFLAGIREVESEQFYKFSADLVLRFLEGFISELKGSHIKILFKSEQVLDSEVVTFSLKHGLYGLILNRVQFNGARKYVSRLEKHHLTRREVEL